MSFTSVQKIRFDDVDGAGIVYYPRYFHLCHAAFEDFFDDVAPISYPTLINDRRKGFPTVAIESSFTAPLDYGDIAVVKLEVEAIGNTSVRIRYDITRKRDAALCFTGKISSVFVDLDSKKPERLPEDLRTIFERFLSA